MDLVDKKYIGLISSRLQKFSQKKSDLYNFRCPLCGDSQKRKNVARGYIYAVKTNTNFKCHNCGASMSFSNFLKDFDVTLHKQFAMEKFKNGHTGKNFVVKEPEFRFEKPIFTKTEIVEKLKIPLASTVDEARNYLVRRKLNPNDFYYTKTFKAFVNQYKQTFPDTKNDHARIIIPLYYQSRLIGFQGRALGSHIQPKYLTVMLNDESPKIYGLDKINVNEEVYVTEGPFDSTFVSNSVAMCGADGDIAKWGIGNPVWVYDNEPRNAQIVARYASAIDRGERIVIWPTNIREKDINDMVLAGLNVMDVLKSNTYSGLEAKIKFNNWKKV